MYINAYSTVRDVIPGEYTHHRGLDDPDEGTDLARHLSALLHFAYKSGTRDNHGILTQGVFELMRHMRQVKNHYVFERDSLAGLEDWSQQSNSVFFLDSREIVNVDGVNLSRPYIGRAVPYHRAAVARSQRIRSELDAIGVVVSEALAPTRSEFELITRSPTDISYRIFALITVAETAAWWSADGSNVVDQLRRAMPEADLAFSREEWNFIEKVNAGDKSPQTMQDAARLSWSSEAAIALAYTLGVVDLPEHVTGRALPRLDDLASTPASTMTALITTATTHGSAQMLPQMTELRRFEDICDYYEHVFSLRWVSVDQKLSAKSGPIGSHVAHTLTEWHRALAWLTEPRSNWDSVDLST